MTLRLKSLGSSLFLSLFFLKKEINLFIQQGHIDGSKKNSKDIHNVAKALY